MWFKIFFLTYFMILSGFLKSQYRYFVKIPILCVFCSISQREWVNSNSTVLIHSPIPFELKVWEIRGLTHVVGNPKVLYTSNLIKIVRAVKKYNQFFFSFFKWGWQVDCQHFKNYFCAYLLAQFICLQRTGGYLSSNFLSSVVYGYTFRKNRFELRLLQNGYLH